MNENEIIMNEEVVEEVMELVPEKNGINFGKIGLGIIMAGAVAALGYKVYQIVKAKKEQKEAQAACADIPADDEDFTD